MLTLNVTFSAAGLDYKGLLDGERDPVDVIGPVLSGSNVHVIAKLAAKIPLQVRYQAVLVSLLSRYYNTGAVSGNNNALAIRISLHLKYLVVIMPLLSRYCSTGKISGSCNATALKILL